MCLDCNEELNFSVGAGPQGPQGAAGANGSNGTNGTDGTIGGFTIEYTQTQFGQGLYNQAIGEIQTDAVSYITAGSNEWWFSEEDVAGNDISGANTFYNAVEAEVYDKIYVKIFDQVDSANMHLYEGSGATIENTGDLRLDMTRLGGNDSWTTSGAGTVAVSFVFVKNGAAGANGSNGTDGTSIVYSNLGSLPALAGWSSMAQYTLPPATLSAVGDYLDIDVLFEHTQNPVVSNESCAKFKITLDLAGTPEEIVATSPSGGTPGAQLPCVAEPALKYFAKRNRIPSADVYQYSMNIKLIYINATTTKVITTYEHDWDNKFVAIHQGNFWDKRNIRTNPITTIDLATTGATIDFMTLGELFNIEAISIKLITN
jgi:hypothetical protein